MMKGDTGGGSKGTRRVVGRKEDGMGRGTQRKERREMKEEEKGKRNTKEVIERKE